MSVPISVCLISAAARLLPEARTKLAERMAYNHRFGVCTIWECMHSPRCPEPTPEQLADLVAELPAIAPVIEHLANARRSGSGVAS